MNIVSDSKFWQLSKKLPTAEAKEQWCQLSLTQQMFSTISNIRKTSELRLARPEQRRQMFMVETDATKQIWKTSQKVYCPCPLQRRQMFMVETDADPRMRERVVG